MRKCTSFILVLVLLLLTGCSRTEKTPQYTLNPDGTVGKLRWGMTYAQAARRVKQIAQEHPDAWWGYEPEGTEVTVFMPQGALLGHWTASVRLIFRHFTAEGKRSPLRLAEIRIAFSPDAELEDLCSRAEEALTLMGLKTQWSWAALETLEDRASREAIAEAYKGYTEEFIQRKCDMPVYTVSVSYTDYQHKLLTASGYYAVLAEILEK